MKNQIPQYREGWETALKDFDDDKHARDTVDYLQKSVRNSE